MGVHLIKMPDIGEGIAEVELVEWHVQPGDSVVEDQLLADVMTDKATVQVPSPVHGKVLAMGGQVGEVMAVGSELIRLEVEGEGNAGKASSARAPADAQASGADSSSTPDVVVDDAAHAAMAAAGGSSAGGAAATGAGSHADARNRQTARD